MNYKKIAIAEVHFHLDGSLSAKSIIKVAKQENIKLPTYCACKLNKYLRVPKNCKSLNEYLERFALPNLVLQSKNGLKTCTLDVLKRLSKQGLKYVEIRMAPQLSTQNGLTQKEVVSTLIEACREGEKFGIKSNLILCCMRGDNNHDKNHETIEVAQEFLGHGVVAVDLAGAEALFPTKLFEKEFELASKNHIPFTIHAGEADGAESVKIAVNYGAFRIGHGIRSVEDEEVLQLLKNKEIYLEICPKSNLDTKTIKAYSELPLFEFYKRGIKFSINTDDMTVSNTKLWKEYRTLKRLGFSKEELKRISADTIDSTFLSLEEKKKLKSLL